MTEELKYPDSVKFFYKTSFPKGQVLVIGFVLIYRNNVYADNYQLSLKSATNEDLKEIISSMEVVCKKTLAYLLNNSEEFGKNSDYHKDILQKNNAIFYDTNELESAVIKEFPSLGIINEKESKSV